MDNLLYTSKEPGLNWGTGCIILNQGRILLGLRVDNGLWGTPGGGVDDGETPMESIVREIKEETNLDVNPLMITFVSRNYSLNEGVIWNSFCFMTNYSSGELKPKIDEFSELKWVAIKDLPNYKLFTPSKEAIAHVMQYHEKYLFNSLLDIDGESYYAQMAELVPSFEGALDIEYTVTKFEDLFKMTSIEQLLGVKNPGKNGGTGGFGSGGNWQYKKPGSGTGSKGKNLALPENRSAMNQQIQRNKKIAEVKQSYVTYFSDMAKFKKLYQDTDGEFTFPEYKVAKDKGICEDKKSYMLVFKEQYVHYVLSQKGGNTNGSKE